MDSVISFKKTQQLRESLGFPNKGPKKKFLAKQIGLAEPSSTPHNTMQIAVGFGVRKETGGTLGIKKQPVPSKLQPNSSPPGSGLEKQDH